MRKKAGSVFTDTARCYDYYDDGVNSGGRTHDLRNHNPTL